MTDTQVKTDRWYDAYYAAKGADRNDALGNPQVDFQEAAMRWALIRALRRAGVGVDARVLDVGCGTGASLLKLLSLGFRQDRLWGIDVLPDRVDGAKRSLPDANLVVGDAADSEFAVGSFDLVMAHTMFIQLTDDGLAGRIAREMVRVTRPGGILLVADWRYDGGRTGYKAMSRARIRSLFSVNRETRWEGQVSGALLPPLGRLVSARAPWAYFLISTIFPPLVAHVTTVLRKLD